ncbi:DUF3027 domain-containing protein [Gordonia jinghuaiqii]|uniref:DUF3027 domain-containing protein n=1 Tax=Gordonia jinghuaiqii TaxID=2758710 RepID=A0A7D7QZ62_9ACTN|nr:DUF3027 domain-containing protein [Gordonia jinghuaiqii]MCR5980634.1 DUF3027 domain-containing protein [Gordonia jinghuaiqii]QMT02689.1 DUF3027 domain-containing protein [Gordonia jinghuaiqii]
MTQVSDGGRLLEAVDIARAALLDEGQQPGAHRRSVVEGEWAVAHYFDAELAGYRGWQWCVVLAGAPGTDEITLSEVVLLPGEGSLLAPPWVPWVERVVSGDLAPGDLLAAEPDDTRLVPNQIDTGDEFRFESDSPEPDDIGQIAGELGLGRKRLLSREGRADAAQRWYDGDFGPTSEMAQAAPYSCCTCGFYVPLAGALRAGFGACANEYAADGRVVSAEYGCGAHSDVQPPKGDGSPAYDAYDDGAVEVVSITARDAEPARS